MYDNFVLSKVFVGIHIAKQLAKHPLSNKGSIYLIVALKLEKSLVPANIALSKVVSQH